MPAPCGSDAGYQHHRALGQHPCAACCGAHAVTNANSRAWLAAQGAAQDPLLYALCRAGREPAESLSQPDRHRLVAELHARGWTDARIAEHCRMTSYTTVRIREHLGLSPNRPATRRGAA